MEEKVNVEEAPKKAGEKGASLVEYAILIGMIAMAAIVAVRSLGSKVSQQFSITSSVLS